MIKPIEDFVDKLDSNIKLDENFVVEKGDRYFLVNEKLRTELGKDFFYAGAYLGKVKDGVFFPSFILLGMMAEGKANKTIVDGKTAWLFICGRDVFKRGIIKIRGSTRRGGYTLILNERNECLGFGRILRSVEEEKGKNAVVVKNISDIGDFLRREK